MLVSEFKSYLFLEKKYSYHTVIAYQSDVLEFAEFCNKEFEITDIDRVDYNFIRSWIVSLSQTDMDNRSINRKISSLKSYFKFLQKIGTLKVNPLFRHKALKTSKKVEIPFSELEMNTVISAIEYSDGFEGKRDQLMINILYSTGIRRAELIQLKMFDVNFDAMTIKVLGKRNKERVLPMLQETKDKFLDYLRERNSLHRIKDKDFVLLTASGNKMYDTLVYRVINKYFKMVSTKVKTSPHILRHTFATHLLNMGADLNAVKELLGHSSLASTQVYVHNSITELKKVHAKSHPRGNK